MNRSFLKIFSWITQSSSVILLIASNDSSNRMANNGPSIEQTHAGSDR
jgi:hypothetical protein